MTFPRFSRALLGLIGAVALSGCTVPVRSDGSSFSIAANSGTVPVDTQPAGTVVVTVPALGGVSPASGQSSAVVSTAVTSTVPSTARATATVTAGILSARSSAGSSTRPVGEPTTGFSGGASSTAAPAPTVTATAAVSLANCAGCAVLATHRSVVGDLSAALVRSGAGRAVLLSLHPDGTVGSVTNVLYGAAFTAPTGAVLPCDGGRCVVIGHQADGHAVASAWSLAANGTWSDASIPGGFLSATAVAEVVDLDGGVGVAVQDQGGGKTVWTVYGWSDGRYGTVGCAPVTGLLAAAELSADACLS